MDGMARWNWPTMVVSVWLGVPSTSSPTSKLVPPMSVVMIEGLPTSEPIRRLAMIPPTGPDRSVSTGLAAALSHATTPPIMPITQSRPPKPADRTADATRSR